MTPYAIMTPGGIADQFTRGLSGVAQAFAQRSAIDRQAKQDALAQARQEQDDIRAAEYLALAQQDRERQAANALTAEADRKRRIEREDADYALKQVALNPNKFINDPVHGGYAARLLEEESRKRQLEDLERMKYRAEAMKGFGEGMVKAREGLLGKPTVQRTRPESRPKLPSFVEMNAEIRKANQTIAELRRQKQVMGSDWTADQEASLTDAINQYNGLQDYIRNNAQAYGLTGAAGALANPAPTATVSGSLDDPSLWK